TDNLGSLNYAEPMAALVYDNSMFGWTGPIDGKRYRLQLSKSVGDFRLNEAMLDFRNYANFKSKVVLATRFTAMKRTGRDSDRFLVYWGGPYFVRGYDAGTFDLTGDECTRSRQITNTQSIS